MAGQGQDIRRTAGEITGQAQVKKDDLMNRTSQTAHSALDKMSDNAESTQGYDIKGQATQFIQQTGEQVKNIAQGAADAVKNTLGMNTDNNNNINTASSPTDPIVSSNYSSNNPSNPTTRI